MLGALWGEFNDILSVGKLGASDDAKAAVDGPRDTFRYSHPDGSAEIDVTRNFDSSRYLRYGSGGPLSRAVGASPQMQRYVDKAKALVIGSIVSNRGGTAELQVQDNLTQNWLYKKFDETGVQYPVYDFSATDATQRACRSRSTSSTGTRSR